MRKHPKFLERQLSIKILLDLMSSVEMDGLRILTSVLLHVDGIAEERNSVGFWWNKVAI